MISRRIFCGRTVAAGALWWTGRPRGVLRRSTTLPVGVVRPETEAAAGIAGLMLGIDEAQTSARLFGPSLEAEIVESARDQVRQDARGLLDQRCGALVSMLPDRPQCAALVAAAGIAGSGRVPVLNAACDADELRSAGCAPHLFHVAASEAMQRDAMRLAKVDDARRAAMWHHTLERYGAGQSRASSRASPVAWRARTGRRGWR